ncbi:VOC family protein [Namhaeicola litoreus]|uniref:VOC family protein n=1 Tax=Namhaeicola litoreus TaxID=1052145 RepID=A0ABW3Y1Z3_9FLAO
MINVYLTFKGNCKEAFDFYKQVFGNDFAMISTFAEMPPQEGLPPLSNEDLQRIMHVTLPVNGDTVLMGSDCPSYMDKEFILGNNFSISINTKNKAEAESFFKKLSVNGKVTMPMSVTFWNAYFGMLTDQFGINWMVNCDL